MPRIKGNSGIVLEVSDSIAEALLKGGEVEVVEDEPKSEPKRAPRRPQAKK